MHGNSDFSTQHIAQIALLGAIGAGGGALACAKVPAINQLVEKLHTQLTHTTSLCGNIPGLSLLFKNNPLLENELITKFLCISAVETGLFGTSVIGIGAIMKATGFESLCPKHLDNPTGHSH